MSSFSRMASHSSFEKACHLIDAERLPPTMVIDPIREKLVSHPAGPLVVRLPKQPGTKEPRVAHLLSGEVEQEEVTLKEPAVLKVQAEDERIEHLEIEVESLREELEALKAAFGRFQSQFE